MLRSKKITAVKGIGQAKAVQLLAAVELGKRLSQQKTDDKFTIRSPKDAATYLMADMTSSKPRTFRNTFPQCQKSNPS